MTRIISRAEIDAALPSLDLMEVIEAGFVAYSAEKSVVPPVGELLLPDGEVHIKYGYLKDDAYYVIKIASGFGGNVALGKSPNNGMMLLFSQKTGDVVAVLLDEGWLTDVRTAVAGAIAAKYMAPKQVERIGIVGTGIQARLQLEYLKPIVACRKVLVWGRGERQVARFKADMEQQGFEVVGTLDSAEIGATCNLIVTTTPAHAPLLMAAEIRPGTHITAVGSDTPHKQELDSAILGKADKVVADSIPQCLARGEIYQALTANAIEQSDLLELGNVIAGNVSGRTSDAQITVADLTGVAVQDIQITKGVYEALTND
ncbi:MAG: ornithine cyclodeaminase family protein [Candidatus Promineifilaceae bacterium]